MRLDLLLNGGLRIEAESSDDWDVLRCIIVDAVSDDLAVRLGGMVRDDGDWEEYVVPDVSSRFCEQLEVVRDAIESAAGAAAEGPGRLEVSRTEAESWYSALNQARLALEEHYHFGSMDQLPPEAPVERRMGFFRSQFYLEIQSVLLERILR